MGGIPDAGGGWDTTGVAEEKWKRVKGKRGVEIQNRGPNFRKGSRHLCKGRFEPMLLRFGE